MHILVLSLHGVRIWPKCASHPGPRKSCWDVLCRFFMNEEDVMYSQRNVCGKRFSIHAEQLLIFKKKTGQGFKWNLCIMQVSPHRRYVCVFKAEIWESWTSGSLARSMNRHTASSIT